MNKDRCSGRVEENDRSGRLPRLRPVVKVTVVKVTVVKVCVM